MNAKELIEKCSIMNIKMQANGEKLIWEAPQGVVGDELLAEMKEHKSAILAFLKAKKKVNPLEFPLLPPKVVKRGLGDFPNAYRPCRISEVYGQDEIKKYIAHGLNTNTLAHALLFKGVSGTGKTTTARIIAMGLVCEKGPTSEPCCECDFCKAVLNRNSFAVQEFDTAHLSGVNAIRETSGDFYCASMGGERKRIVIFDESHRLSDAAQAALLKPTEDSRDHLHFIFCTTEKLLKTLENRCVQFEFKSLSANEIRALLLEVCASEKFDLHPQLIENIIFEAQGMPRNALFLLQEALTLGSANSSAEDYPKDT
jgi:DNA polymerase III subunit gamma/tau